jgi:hypothetical protein
MDARHRTDDLALLRGRALPQLLATATDHHTRAGAAAIIVLAIGDPPVWKRPISRARLRASCVPG